MENKNNINLLKYLDIRNILLIEGWSLKECEIYCMYVQGNVYSKTKLEQRNIKKLTYRKANIINESDIGIRGRGAISNDLEVACYSCINSRGVFHMHPSKVCKNITSNQEKKT